MKKHLLCWLFFSGFTGLLTAQAVSVMPNVKHTGFNLDPFLPDSGIFFYKKLNKSFFGVPLLAKILLHSPPLSPPAKENLLPPWTLTDLPFFCRIEHDCGKKLPFAFKFRLGSVEYVDQLEGKTRWMGQ